MKVIIVGGVAGGASAAARLRRLDEDAQIIMIERGSYISYANCGLPYYVGGDIERQEALTLQTPQSFSQRFNVDVRVSSTVTGVDAANKTVVVSAKDREYTEDFDYLILSPGATPIVPEFAKLDYGGIFTVRTVDDAVNIRQYLEHNSVSRALVIGGGYIGVEMAENLINTGKRVTLAELNDQVIPPLDIDVACEVHNYLRTKGLDLRLNTAVTGLEKGEGAVTAILSDGTREQYEVVVVAVGVRPDTDFLQKSGIILNSAGAIVTDANMRTNFPYIYAVGDAAEVVDFITQKPAFIPLAGPANRQGRIAADNICGIQSRYKGTQGSAIVKIFDMTAATTGISEKTARINGIDYGKIHMYSASHATYYPGATFMAIKVLFDNNNGCILGAQVVGFDGVDKRCDVFAVAIRHKLTADDLIDLELCYAPPYASAKEPVNMAGFMIENILSGKTKNFYVEDIPKLADAPNVQRIDARTEWEFNRGSIKGFINIPLHILRDNLSKLDKSKPVYVFCHSGQRSYMAARILKQNGFDAYNLSGGYRLYKAAIDIL